MADPIRPHTRKQLWTKAGNCCAFTGCGQPLLHPTEAGSDNTIVGVECHIVAKRDHASVARALSSLSDKERVRWALLVERRHEPANLVLMCSTHAKVIDDPAQEYSVEQVVEMKALHEDAVRHQQQTLLVAGSTRERATATPQPLLLEDVGVWQRKATTALNKVDPAAYIWLSTQIGTPAEAEQVADLIARWPDEISKGPRELALLLVREAEALAMWEQAGRAWEHLAAEEEGSARADFLARAAISAGIGRDAERRERLLTEAESLDAGCARARLERFDNSPEGPEQLSFLADIHSEDDALEALIESQRALAYLRMSDLESAEAAIERARGLDPDSISVRIARVNLELQRARLALAADRPFIIAHLLDVYDQAMELREGLVAMGRWVESVRLLMMASDARSLLRDQAGARTALEQAHPEEIESEQGAAVLGDAALRAGAPELALFFVEGIELDDGMRRIAASAHGELGGPGQMKALEELEELATGGGPEAEASAAARLILCMPPVGAAWSESAAAVLEGGEYERYVSSMRVLRMASEDPPRALELARELPAEAWAAEVRLRAAGISGEKDETAKAAREFLAYSPDGAGRMLAAQGLAQAGELERAGEIAGSVARDPNCPAPIRSDAFNVTMKTLADRDQWDMAERTWEEWRDFTFMEFPSVEGRVSAWQVRVVHNQRRPAQQN